MQYAGAIYHVMNRGDRREPIFKDDRDRRRFLETLGQACEKIGWPVHAGPELREADALRAEGLVAQELRRCGWTEADLAQRRKGDPDKVLMAWRLRQEGTMALKWIAQRLNMGTWSSVSNGLVQKRKQHEKCK